jgi:hypothetical protein
MEQGPLGVFPKLRTPRLPATHVEAETGQHALARYYTLGISRTSIGASTYPHAPSRRTQSLVASITTRITPSSPSRSASTRSDRVIVG